MLIPRNTCTAVCIFSLFFLLSSCLSESFGEMEMNDAKDPAKPEPTENKYKDFDFKTVHDYQVQIRALDGQDQPLDGAYLEFFVANPLDADGQLLEEADTFRIFSGVTDANGRLQARINPALTVDSLYILPYYIGLESLYAIPLQRTDIQLILGGRTSSEDGLTSGQVRSLHNEPPPVRKKGEYYVLGEWHKRGRPDYLEKQDVKITGHFLEDLNEALPEKRPLSKTNPDLFYSEEDANIHLQKDAEVFLTFVSENGGPNNSLGYYTYPTKKPPKSVKDLTDQTIIFPLVRGHGKMLDAGNTVQLYYLDQESGNYTATFPEGVSVGWFYIKKGWPHLRSKEMYYSNSELNTDKNDRLRKHNVSIYDDERERMLVGFETIGRGHRSDYDYNDITFFTSTTPATAVDRSQYFPLKEAPDTDSDGIDDNFDAYPDNADRAFDNFYPAKGHFGSLAYEDLWPSRGDYDFNDLVINYNYNPITNADNMVTALEARIMVRAIGASFRNAFGIQLNVPHDKIASVTGQKFSRSFLQLRNNGTELNQSRAVIFFFDDAYNLLPHPGSGSGVNTVPEAPYVEPRALTITIQFKEPITLAQLGPAPYNSFMVVDGQRSVEIHLPGKAPTDLADTSLFGTGDDDSDVASAKYYMSDDNLPWGLNIPFDFEYPVEKQVITNTYLKFDNWAVSRGAEFNNWYESKSGYKNTSNIYQPN